MNQFTINFQDITKGYKSKLFLSFKTKKESNKVLKDMLDAKRIQIIGYDFYTTGNNLELELNYGCNLLPS